MGRGTRRDGLVAACVWDHETGTGPLGPFWDAAHQLDPDVNDESTLAGARTQSVEMVFKTVTINYKPQDSKQCSGRFGV